MKYLILISTLFITTSIQAQFVLVNDTYYYADFKKDTVNTVDSKYTFINNNILPYIPYNNVAVACKITFKQEFYNDNLVTFYGNRVIYNNNYYDYNPFILNNNISKGVMLIGVINCIHIKFLDDKSYEVLVYDFLEGTHEAYINNIPCAYIR
jgi:hypothetical protein